MMLDESIAVNFREKKHWQVNNKLMPNWERDKLLSLAN